ncbi:MAG: FHA domain-containing protein [Persicimonas sp.]
MPSFRLEYDNDGTLQEFSFDGDSVSIGRDKSSDFVLDHPTVSRQHALIVYKTGGYHLVVVSRGGLTAIDGEQIQGEVPLFDGSRLRMGKLSFRFRSLDAPQKPAPSPSSSSSSQPQAAGFGGGYNAMESGFGRGTDGSSQPGQSGQQNGGGFDAGGFGGSGFGDSGFGDSPAPGAGGPSTGFGPSSGGAAQPSQGQQPQGAQQPEASGEKSDEAGIVSWDDIASSSEAMDDGPQASSSQTIYDRMNSNKEDEKTNPLLVVVAGAAIIGLLWFSFFNDDSGPSGAAEEAKPVEEQEPVKIEVSCMGESACVKKAQDAYRVGIEKLERKDASIVNLFTGYKKLLESEAYLEKAGRTELPPEMSELEAQRDASREELTKLFRNYRVQYHRAKKRNEHRDMAQALDAIKSYFPDKTAREHSWANRAELDMKAEGIYPKRVYPLRR